MTVADTQQKPAKQRKPVNLAPAPRPFQIAVAALFAAGVALAIASRPRLDLLFAAPTVVQVHLYAAVAALALGGLILVLRKGRTFHKVAGWIWVTLMVTVAAVSLFITDITPGHWSPIHLISGWVLFAMPLAVFFIRRGNVVQHRRMMTYTYLGGLIIAGAFTFLPGRLMWQVFFGG